MLNELLNLARPLFVIDTETTGTNPDSDKIVEIGFQQWGPEGLIKEQRRLINPGIPIPAGASAVHGITDAAVKDACFFRQIAVNLARGLVDCDFAGQNVRFDLRIIEAEMRRAGQSWSYTKARIIDSHRLEALAFPRDLSSLYEKYTGQKHDGAHGALADVKASADVIAAQLQSHLELPRDLDALHALQWPGFIDSAGLFKFVNGNPIVTFGKWRNKSMRSVDRDYWVWMSSSKADFSDEVKTIAAAAALGNFPK